MTGYIAQEYLIPENWGKKKNELTVDDVHSHGALIQKDEISIQVLTGFEGNFLGCFTSKNVLKNGVPMLIEPLREDTSGAEKTAKEIAAYLATLGLKGPCNLQCKITTAGPVFFESNLRFTGITAVRTAMGFREVEACIRSMVFHDNADKIRRECLETDYGYICSRYITEYLFPVDKAPVAGGGRTHPNAQTADHPLLTPDVYSEGRGWSVHL